MPTSAPAAPAHRPPPYALLVEDDLLTARAALRLLAREFVVEHATTCREALELAARPGLVGWARRDRSRSRRRAAEHPSAHIVIWSGRASYEDVVSAKRVGCAYLPKDEEDEKALPRVARVWLDAIRARAVLRDPGRPDRALHRLQPRR